MDLKNNFLAKKHKAAFERAVKAEKLFIEAIGLLKRCESLIGENGKNKVLLRHINKFQIKALESKLDISR